MAEQQQQQQQQQQGGGCCVSDHDHHHHHHHDHEHGEGHHHHHHHHHEGEEGHHHHHHHEHGHHHHHHDHGHEHEVLTHPGFFAERQPPIKRTNFSERAYTVGIGGPVGSGKTALVFALCKYLRDNQSVGVVTNDIFTKEDAEFLLKNNALVPPARIRAVETGGCPHAAIREDVSANMLALEQLTAEFDKVAPASSVSLEHGMLLMVESGGDNLAANFSRELADYTIYVIDVAGGDKVPRKGGPGITQSDLLIINKTDLAQAVGADLVLMEKQAVEMRQGGPVIMAQVKHGVGVKEIADHIIKAWHEAVDSAKAGAAK
eukprot:TRINITY_DN5270_c0_g1_i1.p1 TRINITY_DN5270_c0_g1~~TRINITY_DN5270_c0_g1_i1.p1  ORF type:complete len:332 (-),score=98.13 TRINITY_DN5270_c0_g1_i1:85-1038(-)